MHLMIAAEETKGFRKERIEETRVSEPALNGAVLTRRHLQLAWGL